MQALLQLDQVDAARWPGMTGVQPLPPVPVSVSVQDRPLDSSSRNEGADEGGGADAGSAHLGANSSPPRASSPGAPA